MKEGGALNALLLLPLKSRSGWRGPFAVGGFSADKLFQSKDIAASTGASGRTSCREWSGYFGRGDGGDVGGGVDGDGVVVFGVGVGDIRLSKKKHNKGLRRMVCAATTKSLGASSRSSQKMNYDGK